MIPTKTTTRHYGKQRADEHTMLTFALSLALSLNSSQPSRHMQTICMCVHVHIYRNTYIHKYSCTRVTLQRVAISSLPLPSQVRCFCPKSLSQALIISCIRYSDALRFACELWAMIAVGENRKARKRKFTEGTHLKRLSGLCTTSIHPRVAGLGQLLRLWITQF